MRFRALSFTCFACFGLSMSLIAEEPKPYVMQNMEDRKMQLVENNELVLSVKQGMLDFLCSFSLYSPLPGAFFQPHADGSFYYSSGIDYAPCNGIIGGPESEPSEEEVACAVDVFKGRQLPFVWWTAAKNLEQQGFQFGGTMTGVALDISKDMPQYQLPANIEIKTIHTEEDLRTFANVTVQTFGITPKAGEQFQAVNTALMHQGEQVHFLALIDGMAVGTATLTTADAVGGVWNLAVLPEYRNKGVGTALVFKALNEAKKCQYDHVMAILMPKGMAWGVFKKLGFEAVCQFPFYVYGASVEELEK